MHLITKSAEVRTCHDVEINKMQYAASVRQGVPRNMTELKY